MGSSSNVQTNFLGGEWSRAAQGRADNPTYKTALARCLNGIPVAPGAWHRRPGFEHCCITRDGAAAKVVPFTRQEEKPYDMEITQGFIRFLADGEVARTNDDIEITAISSANPAEVTTASAHGKQDIVRVIFIDLGQNNPLLQGREFVGTITGTTTFTLSDPFTGDAIDGSTLGTFVSGSVGFIQELENPFSDAALPNLRAVQFNQDFDTKMALLSSTSMPQIVAVTSDEEEDEFVQFEISPANFQDGPYLDPYKNSQVTPTGTTGLIALNFDFKAYDSTVAYSTGDYVTSSAITYRSLTDENQNNTPASSPDNWEVVDATEFINKGEGLLSSDLGRHIRLLSEPPLWVAATTYASGAVISYNGVSYTALQGSNTGKTPDAQPTFWSITPSAQRWTWAKITSVTGSVASPISSSLGTIIGDMSSSAAAFDDDTTQTNSDSATKSGRSCYIGKNYSAAPQSIASAIVYATSNVGFSQFGGTSVTLNLRASQTAPASRSDGTLLGTVSFADDDALIKTITSTDQVTEWKYVWIEMVCGNTAITVTYVAEVVFNSVVASGGTGCSVQIMGDPLLYTSAIRTFQLGLYSDTTGWPRVGVGHEGRLWLSGGAKNRIDASRSNKPFVFSTTETDGAVTGSCAFSYTFNSKQCESIYWMHSERQGVLCGTDGGEWLLQATATSNPLTPTTVQANKGTHVKCANIEPAVTEHTVVFIQKYRRRVVEYFADVNAGKFAAPNLTEYAQHMTKGVAREVCYQRDLAQVVWMRDGLGKLKGCTYKRDSLISSAPAENMGWHRHELGSGREITSMCVGPSVNDETDALTIVTKDPATDIHHIEKLKPMLEQDAELTEAWFLDNAVAPTSYIVDVVAKTVTINGLWHLNDQEVSIWAGGLDLGEGFAVENGSITVGIGEVDEFTLPFVQKFGGNMPIVVGFSYSSQGQLLRPITPTDTGAQAGPGFGKMKRSHQYAALLENAKGVSFGTEFTRMKPAKLETEGGKPLTAFQTKSGVHVEPLEDVASYNSMVCWEITRPYPCTVVMAGGFIQTADK